MGIILRSLIHIPNVSVSDAMYLAVFKKRFLEFVGEIMREYNNLIYTVFFYGFCMVTYSAEIFEMTLLIKRC